MRNSTGRRVRRASLGLALALGVPAAALAATDTFTGTTSQHRRVVIELARGRVVQKASIIHWRAACTNPHGHRFPPLTQSTDFGGKLHDNRLDSHGSYTSYPGGPTTERNTASIRLKLSRRRITGSFSLSAVVLYEGSKPPTLVERCHTGRITFTARR